MLELINRERAKVGAAPLVVFERARTIAASWSRKMLKDRYISHNDEYFSAETRRELGASALGENVAMDNRVDDAHENLMNSAGHRANILDKRFNAIGVGVVTDNLGVMYITQDFLRTSKLGTASAPAPARVVAAAPRVKTPTVAATKPRPRAGVKSAAPKPPAAQVAVAAVAEVAAGAPPSTDPDVATVATTPVTHRPKDGMRALPIVAGAALVAIGAALAVAPSSRRMFRQLRQSTNRSPDGAIESPSSLANSTTNSLR